MRPVTMVIAFAPGGPIDTLARNLQPYLGETLGQQVVIENVAGGGGAIGSLRVANATADSHMFTLGSIGTHAIGQSMHKKPPYNAVTDFLAGDVGGGRAAGSAGPQGPAGERPERVSAYAKANQDKMQHGSGGAGTSSAHRLRAVEPGSWRPDHACALSRRRPRDAGSARQVGSTSSAITFRPRSHSHKAKIAKVIAALGSQRTASFPEVRDRRRAGLQGSRYVGVECDLHAEGRDAPAGREAQCRAQQGAGQSGAEEAAGGHRTGVPIPYRRTPEYLAKFTAEETRRWEGPVKASGVQFD